MSKFLILTDSSANSRSFPASEITQLEETYPYLIRSEFSGSTFWQLSYGNISTEHLVSQAISYLSHWKPDIIIVHSGMADCRPEAFTEFQKAIITQFASPLKYTGRIFKKLSNSMYHPKLIKRRQIYRVTKRRFNKTLKKFKLIFASSKIFWLEICAGTGYEEMRPGVNKRMEEYNNVIRENYGDGFVPVQEKLIEVDGFNIDNMHWKRRGHKAVAEILIEKINNYLNNG